MFPLHQGKAYVGSQCRAGKKQGGSPKQMVRAAARNVPANPPPESSEPRAVGSSQPSQRCFMAAALLRKTLEARYRESAASRWVSKAYRKWVQLLAAQKPIKRQGWGKGKFALFQRPATRGWGVRFTSQGQLPFPPPCQSVGKSFYRGREEATCRNSTVSSDRRLETGRLWFDDGLT